MKIVSIEEQTFLKLKEELSTISKEIDNLKSEAEETIWLDNQEVCQLLDISKRTLQNYRDKGILPHSMIRYKSYYKKEDVQKLIDKSINK